MRIELINLDRSADRLAEFNAYNRHLSDVARFSAVEGTKVDRKQLVDRGTIEADLDYTAGALGNLLSHLEMWKRAAEENTILTVCEDDAIFNKDFERIAPSFIEMLPPDWHYVAWGWNFDAFTLFELVPGVTPFLANFDQAQMRSALHVFQGSTLSPRPFRMLALFGAVCYSISPSGARALSKLCIPVRSAPVTVGAVNRTFAQRDICIAMLECFPRMNAFASFPPLVVTKNDHSQSTVLNHSTAEGRT